jgi:hypothetical protein
MNTPLFLDQALPIPCAIAHLIDQLLQYINYLAHSFPSLVFLVSISRVIPEFYIQFQKSCTFQPELKLRSQQGVLLCLLHFFMEDRPKDLQFVLEIITV